ncbi:alpha/beta hydrolase [Streptomyces sp. NPDC127197]|uniref:alpha/beta hydrolase n=1 Tax=Streptomyces sp. NPDC127197 TaxID=3345388 RepID=UPI00362B4980
MRPADRSVGGAQCCSTGLGTGESEDCVVVFFHGGGFVKGDLDSHDDQARTLCAATGRPVVSVDCRLAPEHPFPSAYDDAVEAVRWAHSNAAASLGGLAHPLPVAVAGTSAGTNLAVGAALAHTPSAPVAQLLVCPIVSGDPALPSRTAFAEGYGLTSFAIERFIEVYLTDPAQRQDPRFAPALSPDLAALPPTVLVGAGFDPLRDDAGCSWTGCGPKGYGSWPRRSRPCPMGSGSMRRFPTPRTTPSPECVTPSVSSSTTSPGPGEQRPTRRTFVTAGAPAPCPTARDDRRRGHHQEQAGTGSRSRLLCAEAAHFALFPSASRKRIVYGCGHRVGLTQPHSLKRDPITGEQAVEPRSAPSEREPGIRTQAPATAITKSASGDASTPDADRLPTLPDVSSGHIQGLSRFPRPVVTTTATSPCTGLRQPP